MLEIVLAHDGSWAYGRRAGSAVLEGTREGEFVSLYDELGGDAAIDAALDAFYVEIAEGGRGAVLAR